MSSFEDKMIEAIVRQWFDPIQQTDMNGNYRYMAQPAGLVAAELLKTREGEIVKAITAQLDMKKVAKDAADLIYKRMTSVERWDNTLGADFQKLVTEKLAQMTAERIMAERTVK